MRDAIAYKSPRVRLAIAAMLAVVGSALLNQQAFAQSSDSLYAQARKVAFDEGDYERARALGYRALERSPNYHGIRVFVARTLAWDGMRDSARTELKTVLDRAPDHYEGLKAMIDVESWSERYRSALEYADQGRKHYQDDSHFIEKRAALLRTLNRPQEARAQLDVILSENPSNEFAKAELRRLREAQRRYTASLSYRHDAFRGGRLPWRFGTFTLSRPTPIGSVIGRIQYANRFSTNGLKFGVDAYPSLVSGLYAYLNAGYSSSSIFPRYRLGGSLYKSLPWSMTAEIGARHLNFGGGGTTIYTASLTKYRGQYMYRAGTYLTPGSTGTSASVNAMARRYLSGSQTYVGANASIGSSPTGARADAFEEDFQRTRSWSVSAHAQVAVAQRTVLGISIGYDSEEIVSGTRRRISSTVSVSYEF